MLLFILFVFIAYRVFRLFRPKPLPDVLDVYFGVPGSGKTTFAAYLASVCQKLHKPVYSNVPISGCYKINPRTDIGFYDLHDCYILIDEASIEYNSRNYKTFPQDSIKWFKLHRHAHTGIAVFSQSWEDMDITLRRLAQNLYLVRRGLIPYTIVRRKINKHVSIDKQTEQIIDGYRFYPALLGGFKLIWCPKLWKMFNSFEMPSYPSKDFELYQ